MGCTASTANKPSPELRSTRGPPPRVIYLRGTGELACDGTYKRIYPNLKGQSKKIPRLLILYVNKRGYTLTNANVYVKRPQFHPKMWTIGHGENSKSPWKGLFVATHKRYYRFNKLNETLSCRPPLTGWRTTTNAHDPRSCPLVAYNRSGDREIRHRSFRIQHGLEDPPRAFSSKSFPKERLRGIQENEENEDSDDSNDSEDSDDSGDDGTNSEHLGFDFNQDSEEDLASDDEDENDHPNSKAKGYKSQFETNRQFAEPGREKNNGNNERVKENNVGQFQSWRPSVQTMKVRSKENRNNNQENTTDVATMSASSLTASTLELHHIYNNSKRSLDPNHAKKKQAKQKETEETEEEQGFKTRSPTNEEEPIVTQQSKQVAEQKVEKEEFSRRQNVLFELEQEKWHKQQEQEQQEQGQHKKQKQQQQNKKPKQKKQKQPQPPPQPSPQQPQPTLSSFGHSKLQNAYGISATTSSPATRPTEPPQPTRQNQFIGDSANTPGSPHVSRSKGFPVPDQRQRVDASLQQMHTNLKKYHEQIVGKQSMVHQRMQVAKEKRKAVLDARRKQEEMDRIETEKQREKETMRRKKQQVLAATRSLSAFNDVNSRVQQALKEEKKNETFLKEQILEKQSMVHQRMQVAKEKRKAVLDARRKQEEMDRIETEKQREKETMRRKKQQVLAATRSLSAFNDVNSRVQQALKEEKKNETFLKVKMMHDRSDSHKRLLARKAAMKKKRHSLHTGTSNENQRENSTGT